MDKLTLFETAATIATDALQRAEEVLQLAIEEVDIERKAFKQAAKSFDNQLMVEKTAATAAADALQQLKGDLQLATEVADIERKAFKQAAIAASEAFDTQLMSQKTQYEKAAIEAVGASQQAKKATELLVEIERKAFKEAAISKSCALDTQLMDQKAQYEKAATEVVRASERAKEAAELSVEIERKALKQATIAASEAFDTQLMNQKAQYEKAAIEAVGASQQAKKAMELIIEVERKAFKHAAISVSKAFDTQILDQKMLYETIAIADASQRAKEATEILLEIERKAFKQATIAASEAFDTQLIDQEALYRIATSSAHDALQRIKSDLQLATNGATFESKALNQAAKAVIEAYDTQLMDSKAEPDDSQLATEEANIKMKAFKQAAVSGSHSSNTQLMDQKILSKTAATVAVDALHHVKEANIELKALKQAIITLKALSEAFDTQLMDQKALYEKIAIEADDASQQLKRDLQLSKAEANIEKEAFKKATISACEAFDTKLMDQQALYEKVAMRSKVESANALEKAKWEKYFHLSRYHLSMEDFKKDTIAATNESDRKLINQKMLYKAVAADALHLATEEADIERQASDTELVNQKMLHEIAATAEANTLQLATERADIERKAFEQSAIAANEAFGLKLTHLKVLNDTATAAAADILQLATEEAGIDHRTSKQNAIDASKISASQLMIQKQLFETVATRATSALNQAGEALHLAAQETDKGVRL